MPTLSENVHFTLHKCFAYSIQIWCSVSHTPVQCTMFCLYCIVLTCLYSVSVQCTVCIVKYSQWCSVCPTPVLQCKCSHVLYVFKSTRMMMFCMTYTCLYSESEHMYCMYCKTYAHKILYNLHLFIQCTHVLYVTMFCMPYTCLFSV